jgi:glycosyltransferase involved in cell wall biosynthesis
MRIAIDGRLWSFPHAGEQFLGAAIIPALIHFAPQHQYFIIFDQTPSTEWKTVEGASILVLKPQADNPASRALWYDLRIPALLSGHKMDVFLGTAGYISLRSPVKQVLLLHDVLSGEQAPNATGWPGSWYRRRLPSMLEKAAHIIMPTQTQADRYLKTHPTSRFTIVNACPLTPMPFPSSDREKEQIKQQLTGDAEFFICREGWQNLEDAMELLIAFSAFKKRQLSGMKLVLMGTPPPEKDWTEKLRTYRYRADVVLVPEETDPAEQQKYLSAAWSLIHLPAATRTRYLQKALCMGIPVITWPHAILKELAGNAAMYCSDGPGETLAQNLMRMYKDEKLRSELIKKGLEKRADWKEVKVLEKILETCVS